MESLRNSATSFLNNSTTKDFLTGKKTSKSFADDLLTKFIAVPEEASFGGFSLDITESIDLNASRNFSDIPVATGIIISQHSTKQPIEITIKGSVFNVFKKASLIDTVAEQVQNKLGLVNAYAPNLAGPVLQKYTDVKNLVQGGLSKIDRLVKDGNELLKSLGQATNENETRIFSVLSKLLTLYETGQIIKVSVFGLETQAFKRMIIKSVNISKPQDIESGKASISAVFREYQEAIDYNLATFDAKKVSQVIKDLTAKQTNKGLVNGKKINPGTTLYNLTFGKK